MKLFNFKEFKENAATDVTVKDYLTYLDSNKAEIEDAMNTAKELGLEEAISGELIGKLNFIDKLLEIIDSNKKSIIMQSIDKLSLEDLQTLYDDKIEKYKRELEESESKLSYYNSQISKEEAAYNKKMIEHGYSHDNYVLLDTAEFFTKPASAHDYVVALMQQEELDENDLREKLSVALHFEAGKAEKNSEDENTNRIIKCMIDGIVTLFGKCHKLNKMLSNKSDYIVDSLLADNGINKIIVEFFKEDITENLFLDIQNIDRENKVFFKNLPESVREKLIDERFDGECYKGLFSYFYALTNNTLDEFKPFDTTELDNLNKEKSNAETEVELVKNEIEMEKQFIQDKEKLKEYLKSHIELDDNAELTLTKLDNFVMSAQGGMKKEMSRMEEIDEEMAQNTASINRLEEILNTKEFQEEQENQEEKELIPQEMLIEPFVEVETARHEQISIMIEAERQLENLGKSISELKANKVKNVISRSHKLSLTKLKREYDTCVLNTFDKLDELGITLVEAPVLIIDKQSGNISSKPSKNKYPKNFDDLALVAHSFWNLEEYMDEIEEYGLAKKEDISKLVAIQKHCVNKLFNYSKDEDGIYQFTIEDSERETLLNCQESIVLIAKALYEKRASLSCNEDKNNDTNIDKAIIAELQSFGLESFTKEELQRTIFALTTRNNTLKDEKDMLVSQCEDSMLEGINSVEEAIMYRDMLIGINEYYVPAEEIIDVLKI